MEIVIAFLVAVAVGVACHYIIKWLDSDCKDNE
jgi:capsular polysaccharide biosynthesis protein